MELLDKIIELISNKGLSLTISIIVIYGAVQLMNIFLEKMKYNLKSKSHDNLLETRKSIDKHINEALERVMLRTKADRAFVFEFHNGTTSLGGLPFLKMSNTYEVVEAGIKPQKYNLEQLSCSMYDSLLHIILEEDYVLLNINDRNKDIKNIVYETLIVQGIHKTILIKITDVHRRTIGYVGIDYCRKDKDSHGESDIVILNELAIEFGALLSVK